MHPITTLLATFEAGFALPRTTTLVNLKACMWSSLRSRSVAVGTSDGTDFLENLLIVRSQCLDPEIAGQLELDIGPVRGEVYRHGIHTLMTGR